MEEDKVLVGFNKYHKQMNELTFLRDLVVSLYFNDITIEKFKEQLTIINKEYKWWV